MTRKRYAILAGAAVLAVSALPTFATSAYTWNGGGADSNWTTPGNWDLNNQFPISGATANFAGSVQTAVTVNGPQAVNTINFNDAHAFTLAPDGTGSITLDASGAITRAAASTVTQTISSPITLAGNATFTDNSNNNTTWVNLSGAISGSGTITINGAVSNNRGLRLSGSNTGFTGNIIVNGNLEPFNNNSLGTSAGLVTVNAGGRVEFGSNIVLNKNFDITGNAQQSSFGAGAGISGTVTVESGATFDSRQGGGNSFNYSGVLAGTGNITFSYGGATLSGSSSNTLNGQYNETSTSTTTAYRTTTLNKSGGAIAINGPLTLSNKAWTAWKADEQIADTIVPVLSGADTAFLLQGHTETLAGLSDGGTAALAGTVQDFASGTTTTAAQLNLATTAANTFHGTIIDGAAGTVALSVSGTGSQTLTGTNTYTGATSITGGTLALSPTGSLGNTAINVAGGTFAPQAGSFAGNANGNTSLTVAANGTYDMTADNGATLGLFTLNAANGSYTGTSLTLAGGTLAFDLGDTLGSNDGLLVANGVASVSGLNSLTIDTNGDTSLTYGDYTLIAAAGGLNPSAFQFTGGGVTKTITVGANQYLLSLGNSSSTAEVLSVSAVPEPASLSLLGLGALGLLKRRRRRV